MQLKYPDVTLRKQIPNAVWGDTLRVNRNSGRQVSVHDMSQLFTVKFSQFVPIDSLIQELEQLPEVEYAHQPVQVILAVDPDDPNYPANQWNLTKVNAAAAWDITRGSSSIVVGIIDPKGVKRAHEDFTNRDQTSQFVAGKGDTEFTESHGTQVAGVVAAATDNTKGIASLGWNIKMIPYKWDNAEDFDEASAQNLANKIFEARNDPIDVLNLSFFTGIEFLNILDCPPKECVRSEDYNSVRDEIENAINSGIIVVASTGNGPINQQLGRGWCFDCESFPYIPYPAAYPGVIGVSATEQDDSFHTGYNYETGDGGEADFIDVAAPGKDILSTSISGYYSEDGTSFAAPLVAALAGLVKSVNPNLSRSQVEQIITSTTLDLGASGRDNFYGYGRIQAQEAVLKAAKKSLNADATAHNGGRRLVRDSSGNYHLIFGSNGEIFYRKIVGGSSWQSAHQLSSGNGNNNFPSIAERGGKVFVTWQRNTGSSHDVYFHKSTDGGASWPSGNRQVLATNVGTSDPLPVIASPATNELMLVYRSNSGLVWKRSTDNGANWTTSGVFTGSTFNSPSVAPGKTPWNADITVLAYATAEIPNTSDIKVDYHSSSWSNEKNLTSDLPGNLSQHAHPSIAFSGNFNSITHVAWDAHDSFRSARVILHKKMGFWSVPST
ncbi:MAG: S8 family serine peptidase [bacterium]